MAALKCFDSHFVKRLALQNTNSNYFAVISNGIMVLSLNSVFQSKLALHMTKGILHLHMSSADVYE